MPVPKGFVLDQPQQAAPSQAISVPPGFVLDQPQAAAQPQQPALAAGPDNTEGTYAMWNGQGQKQQVPYSNVGKARTQGWQFDTNPGPSGRTPQAQYQQDLNYDLENSLPPSVPARAASATGDLIAGAGKGAAHTFLDLAGGFQRERQWEQKTFPGLYTAPTGAPTPAQGSAYVGSLRQKTAPTNLPQKIGFYGEQAGEFMAPGGLEEDAARGLTKLPGFAEAAPAMRMGMGAVSSGLVNKAQGGSFRGGAIAGAAAGAGGEVLRAAAPKLAESALGIRNTDRAFNANPGKAVLRETSALSPAGIAGQAQTRLGELTALQRGFAQENPRMVSLYEPTEDVTKAMRQQAAQNSASGVDRLNPLRQQLMVQSEPKGGFPVGITPRRAPGQLIPMRVPGEEALDLRAGVGSFQADKPWTGRVSSDPLTGAVRNAYGSLSRNIHGAYPEIAPLDARMHDLIPVAQRAAEVSTHAPALQRIAGRFARPTGALIGATGGGLYGYERGGVPGAVEGAVGGLVLPELLAKPEVQMGIARGLYKAAPAVSRGAAGVALNLRRSVLAPPLTPGQLALIPPR